MQSTEPAPASDKRSQILEEIIRLEREGQRVFFSELLKNEHRLDKATRKELEALRGQLDLKAPFAALYQNWYSRALPVVKQLAPDRYDEFQRLYLTDKKGKTADFLTYSISDYLLGVRVKQYDQDMVDPFAVLSSKFQQQLNIFASLRARATSVISEIQGVLQAELLDNELKAAEELLTRHQIRAAGALAGVTLERHLASVCGAHAIKFRKRNPSISDYNDALKDHNILDLPSWRQIQFLADVRNACVHWRDKEPQQEQVGRMVAGVQTVIKQVF